MTYCLTQVAFYGTSMIDRLPKQTIKKYYEFSQQYSRKKELKKALEVAEKHFQVFNKMVKLKQKQKILKLLKK